MVDFARYIYWNTNFNLCVYDFAGLYRQVSHAYEFEKEADNIKKFVVISVSTYVCHSGLDISSQWFDCYYSIFHVYDTAVCRWLSIENFRSNFRNRSEERRVGKGCREG